MTYTRPGNAGMASHTVPLRALYIIQLQAHNQAIARRVKYTSSGVHTWNLDTCWCHSTRH